MRGIVVLLQTEESGVHAMSGQSQRQQEYQYQPYDTFGEPQHRKGMSTRAKWAIGCGLAAVIVVVLVCGGMALLAWFAFDRMYLQYVNNGYTQISGDQIVITTLVEADTIYVGDSLELKADANADIAFSGNTADIYGRVDGQMDFNGNSITIHPGAVITGDLKVFGGKVILRGEVQGKITGWYGELIDERESKTDMSGGGGDEGDSGGTNGSGGGG